ncbi:recombinase family protein [Sulfitobacter sp. G21635-S1]|uniref:recombinase family protein n=1 Tax=Rhodobacterales TaxID=204455 RepID=UPI0022AFF035|nr:recombinase family protein [Sulfitobacter sp. G21635-S1]MCZ4258700.1 recombinase family protein [Sulfitobacter sp. G21635-S1]
MQECAAGGKIVGYARVSKADQSLAQQIAQLRALGCDEIYTDQLSGKNARREGLQSALDTLTAGDQLVVPAFDRLGRNQRDLLNIAQELDEKGVALRSLREDIDTRTPLGRMFYSVCAMFAQFERDLISHRTKAGLAAAKAAGRRGGRPKAMDADMRNVIEQKLVGTKLSITAIAKEHGISPSTIYNAFPGGRSALTAKRFKVVSDYTAGMERFQVVEDSKTGGFYWRLMGDTPQQDSAPYGPFETADEAAASLRLITVAGTTETTTARASKRQSE